MYMYLFHVTGGFKDDSKFIVPQDHNYFKVCAKKINKINKTNFKYNYNV